MTDSANFVIMILFCSNFGRLVILIIIYDYIPHLLLLVKDLKDSDWERFLPIPTLTQSTKE